MRLATRDDALVSRDSPAGWTGPGLDSDEIAGSADKRAKPYYCPCRLCMYACPTHHISLSSLTFTEAGATAERVGGARSKAEDGGCESMPTPIVCSRVREPTHASTRLFPYAARELGKHLMEAIGLVPGLAACCTAMCRSNRRPTLVSTRIRSLQPSKGNRRLEQLVECDELQVSNLGVNVRPPHPAGKPSSRWTRDWRQKLYCSTQLFQFPYCLGCGLTKSARRQRSSVT